MDLIEELIQFIRLMDSYNCGCCRGMEEDLENILESHNYENKNK